MSSKQRIPVTMRAVIQRINRALQSEDRMLRAVRGARAKIEFGDYYILDTRRNFSLDTHVDPEALGRELGVLKDYERLVDD